MKKGHVLGVGINDANYLVGNTCPFYKTWLSMMERCYSPRNLKTRPNYKGCVVYVDWHTFSVFKEWMLCQDWQGKQLDKDLLIQGNKIYGPDTCLFVSGHINTLLSTKKSRELPTGVNKQGIRYKASMQKYGKLKHIGVYDTVDLAYSAYIQEKAAYIREIANQDKCVKTKAALLRIATNLLI